MTADLENITERDLSEEVQKSFLTYAISVVTARALPSVLDGMKPVIRRAVYAAYDGGYRSDKKAVKSSRIVGDCFVEGALVSTPGGLRVIEDLAVGDEIQDVNGRAHTISERYIKPTSELVDVNLANGHTIRTTPGQRFQVVNDDYTISWCEARDLAGKRVLGQGPGPADAEFARDVDSDAADYNYVLGLMVAEGSQVHRDRDADGRTSILMVDKEPLDLCQRWAQKSSLRVVVSERPKQEENHEDAVALRFARHEGLLRATEDLSFDKTVPECVLEDKSVWAPFLAGYFDGDGYVRKDRREIVFATTSKNLGRQIYSMLARLGVSAHWWVRDKEKQHHHDLYGISVSATSAQRLAKILTPWVQIPYKSAGLQRVSDLVSAENNMENTLSLPGKAVFKELSEKHLGAGWYRDAVTGAKFRQSMRGERRSKPRYGLDNLGRTLEERSFDLERAQRDGWVDKLDRIGSNLGSRLRELSGHTFVRVATVEAADAGVTYDIQVDSEDHAFVVEGMSVHNCMGKYHPHGDSAVYETIVGLVQPWGNNIPLFQGDGNWGSVGKEDPAAAPRYTEARLTPAAEIMCESISEDSVDMADNYDATLKEPSVLPAAFPNLLVNGTSGIAVGMSCSFAPHNLTEVTRAMVHLLHHPDATVDDLMKFMPGPDFPTGGVLVDDGGIKAAYETGRGRVRMRAKTSIEDVSARKRGIVVTELPYGVGPEAVMTAIAEEKGKERLTGVGSVTNYTDRRSGLRLVIEVKSGANPDQVLAQLFRWTPLQLNFHMNQVALVGREPRLMGLIELCQHYLGHRVDVITRRTKNRLKKAEARAHIVEGYIKAHEHIDEIVKLIKASKTAKVAAEKLCTTYDLSETQAAAILEMTLRRLTGLEIDTLKEELKSLHATIGELKELLASDEKLRQLVGDEMEETAKKLHFDRRSEIITGIDDTVAASLDDAVTVEEGPLALGWDVDGNVFSHVGDTERPLRQLFHTTTTSEVGVVTDKGTLLGFSAMGINGSSYPLTEHVELPDGEQAVGLVPRRNENGSVVLVTERGFVKKIDVDQFAKRDGLPIMKMKDPDDRIITAVHVPDGDDASLALVTSEGRMLRIDLSTVRAQGRTGGGVAGIKLAGDAKLVGAGVITEGSLLVTVTDSGTAKATPADMYPTKGRGGAGVRCHNFKKGDSHLVQAVVTPSEAKAASARAVKPVKLVEKRDGSGVRVGLSGELVLGF